MQLYYNESTVTTSCRPAVLPSRQRFDCLISLSGPLSRGFLYQWARHLFVYLVCASTFAVEVRFSLKLIPPLTSVSEVSGVYGQGGELWSVRVACSYDVTNLSPIMTVFWLPTKTVVSTTKRLRLLTVVHSSFVIEFESFCFFFTWILSSCLLFYPSFLFPFSFVPFTFYYIILSLKWLRHQ